MGLVVAFVGILLHQVTGSPVPDAIGSIVVGLILAVISWVLIDRNRRFLVGERPAPRRGTPSCVSCSPTPRSTASRTCASSTSVRARSTWSRASTWWGRRRACGRRAHRRPRATRDRGVRDRRRGRLGVAGERAVPVPVGRGAMPATSGCRTRGSSGNSGGCLTNLGFGSGGWQRRAARRRASAAAGSQPAARQAGSRSSSQRNISSRKALRAGSGTGRGRALRRRSPRASRRRRARVHGP
ncbi:hypothetical protein NKG05_09465 [Oerskovia sp. M15]